MKKKVSLVLNIQIPCHALSFLKTYIDTLISNYSNMHVLRLTSLDLFFHQRKYACWNFCYH